jgi:F-type H+-transporting ATPase subunit a
MADTTSEAPTTEAHPEEAGEALYAEETAHEAVAGQTEEGQGDEAHQEEGGHGGLHVTLAADEIGNIGPLPVTNALLVTWIASAILLVAALRFSKVARAIPGRFQAMLELVFDGLLSFMDAVTGSREKTKRFGPITLTIFFLVLVANWLELLPGFESIFIHGVPLLRAPSSDFNLTLALAVIAVVSTHVLGVRTLGALKHTKKYFSANPINTFIGVIEIVGDVAKILSFSLRLFGNIFAGSILLLVIGFLVPWGAPLPFMGLEIIVGLIQALVFSVLTLVFMTMATEEHH